MSKLIDFDSDEVDAKIEAEVPKDTPLVMINFLAFKDQAQYAADTTDEPCSGIDAYKKRYMKIVGEVVEEEKIDFQVLFWGAFKSHLLCPPGEKFDEVLIIRYPNREGILRLSKSKKYQSCKYHRTAAIADSRLWATVDMS